MLEKAKKVKGRARGASQNDDRVIEEDPEEESKHDSVNTAPVNDGGSEIQKSEIIEVNGGSNNADDDTKSTQPSLLVD
jgi:hypothetical protein